MIHKKTTEEILAESILELSKKKPVNKITIKEITSNCGMSPGTFYNHFRDKLELIAWIYLDHIAEFTTKKYMNREGSLYDLMTEHMQLLDSERSFYKNALANTSGQNSFFESSHNGTKEMLRNVIREKSGKPLTPELEFYIGFYIKGFGYMVEEWLLHDSPYTNEEIARCLCESFPEELKKYLD